MKKCLFLLLFISSCAFGQSKQITDPVEIQKILVQIPYNDKEMPYKNISERLPKLGLTVSLVTIGKLAEDEYRNSNGLYKKGDVLYQFVTNDPNTVVTSICPIFNSFDVIKRGKLWIPTSRTANFLMNYKCVAPQS